MIKELIEEFSQLSIEDISTDHDSPNGTEEIVIEIYPTDKYNDAFLYEFQQFVFKIKKYCMKVQYDVETFKPSAMIYIMQEQPIILKEKR